MSPPARVLSSKAAEFFVLARLLANGIESHKTYGNYPGYDIVCLNPHATKLCRIQVKSRRAVNFDKRFDVRPETATDFFVLVALNIERLGGQPLTRHYEPLTWVVPTAEVERLADWSRSRGQLDVRKLPVEFHDGWNRVRQFLEDT